MTLQEFYTRIGGNYDDTLRRIPSEALVRKFVLKYPNDPSFGQLKDALAAQDWETAFRASHAEGRGPEFGYGTPVSGILGPVRGCARLQALTDPALWPPVEEAHAQVLAAIQEL
ncbi:MAG: hypothetical protein EP147_00220 [Subdoligranulum sp.]|nr:hypothetical protein [Subdoligranulum sp.]